MRLTLRVKLLLIGLTGTLALVAVVVGGALSALQQSRDMADVEGRLVPRLRKGPEIRARFERVRQQMRDAVAAQDLPALEATAEQRDQLLAGINQFGPMLDPSEVQALRTAVQEYLTSARSISERLIAGEAGEAIISDIEVMQARDRRAVELIERTTTVGEPELKAGFDAMRAGAASDARFRLVMGGTGLLLLVVFSVLLMRGVLRSVNLLSQGFARFATGQFTETIPVLSRDELGDAAKEANQMAESLSRLSKQRDRSDWLRAAQMGLSDQLRDDVAPKELARRALWFLCKQIGAARGALYLNDGHDRLRLVSQFAGDTDLGDVEGVATAPPTLRIGQGLLGQAALSEEVMVVTDLPPGYFTLGSALGEASPGSLVLVPLSHLSVRVGVFELGLLGGCSDDTKELLAAVRESLALALSVAASRARQSELLSETRELALRLASQEEELRVRNQDLTTQQGELRHANDELEVQRTALSQRNVELEEARTRVQQKAEELARVSSYKSQFLANMSHELRTPLNSMLLLSGLLAENPSGNLTQKQVEHAKTVNSAGRDLLRLINQVLDLAKIEAGKQEVEFESVSVRSLEEHLRGVFSPLAAEKGLRLVTHVDPNLPSSLVTDRDRLHRILANLLGNAIKFTEAGGVTLRIGALEGEGRLKRQDLRERQRAGGRCFVFEVIDTGPGIDASAQERVFAPFEQVDARSNRRYAGTGLGLAIARESAELLGGELTLHSTVGQGSTFTCVLPDASGAEAPTLARSEIRNIAALVDDRERLAPNDESLLIIEDDPAFAEQLLELTRARNFKALLASTGSEGLRMAREHQPRGIMLDVGLPDLDGWTVMERLKHDPATRAIPVHFLSGTDAPQRGLALGAVGYLVKPASRPELMELVRALTSYDATPGSRRVLVVEDDPAQGESLLSVLRGEGVEVEHVMTAAGALSKLATTAFDCMVLDLGLPDMDGLGLLESLAARSELHHPRVLVHTGRTLTKAEHKRLQQYVAEVIPKNEASSDKVLENIRNFVTRVRRQPIVSSKPSAAIEPGNPLQGLRILVTDDDMRTVYALSALLRTWGADVIVADTGREALDVLARTPKVDLVLMDVMMPEMDGYEAMRRIRQEPRFSRLPVLALTASAMKGERERCIDAGASEYLTKPLESERLLALLRGWRAKGELAV